MKRRLLTTHPVRLLAGLGAAAALSFQGPLLDAWHSVLPVAQTRFTAHVGTHPLRWETCSTIPVIVNPGPFGPQAVSEIRSAFARVNELTGLHFRVTGTTSAVPRSNWALTSNPGPSGFAPVLVGWTTSTQTDLLSKKSSGGTVANPANHDGMRSIVTGAVAFDADQFDDYKASTGPGRTRSNLVLHELGHLVGLAHVDAAALMNPIVGESSPDGFTQTELAALSTLRPTCSR